MELRFLMLQSFSGGKRNKGFRQKGRRNNEDNNDKGEATNKKDETNKKEDEAPAQASSDKASGSPTLKRKPEDNANDDQTAKKTKSDE